MGHALIRPAALAAAVAVAVAAAACTQNARTDPQTMADQTTRAVYDDNLANATKYMDDTLKSQVTAGSLGGLSDRLHALGAMQGLKPSSSDADKGRYDYEATFDKGSMLVQIRVDPNGKLAAYRLSPVIASAR